MQEEDPFADAVGQLLRGECPPARVRAIEAGDSPDSLWRAIEDAGFADALVPEDAGGAGLSLSQARGMWVQCGACALPVPLAETMVVRALLAQAGLARPAGSITLAEGRLEEGGGLFCSARLGRVADHVLVQHADGWSLMAAAQARSEPAAFALDADLRWPAASCVAVTLPAGLDARTLQACFYAAQLSGALASVLERTLRYANERRQFGRPIGKFQAIQHQLAVMSEHVFAAHTAAQLGCAGDGIWPDRLRVAVAKARCSQAALTVAELGHAVHGAIGFTAEYDLQLFTRRLHAWRQAAGGESYWHDVAGEALLAHQGATLDLVRGITDAEPVP